MQPSWLLASIVAWVDSYRQTYSNGCYYDFVCCNGLLYNHTEVDLDILVYKVNKDRWNTLRRPLLDHATFQYIQSQQVRLFDFQEYDT